MSSRGQLLVEAVNQAMIKHRSYVLAGRDTQDVLRDVVADDAFPALIAAVRSYLADAPTDEIVEYMPVYPEFEERVSWPLAAKEEAIFAPPPTWPEVRDAAAAARGDYRFGRAL